MGQHRREDINGDTKQNCSNRRGLHQNREKMTTRMDKTCDMIVHIIPPNYTHTRTSISTHTSTHSSWWEGRLSDMAAVRKVNLGRWARPMPWLILGFPHPLMQGSGLCSQHIYIRNGSHRAVLSTPSHMIESHPHPHSHIHILYNYCFFDLFCFIPVLNNPNPKFISETQAA